MPRRSLRVEIAFRFIRVPLASAGLLALALPATAQVAAPATVAPAAQSPQSWPPLKLDPSLNGKRTTPPDMLPAFARAQHITGASGDGLVLEGDAEIRKNGTVLRGDRITYTQLTDEVNVEGNARLFTSGASFRGPGLRYKVDAGTGEMPEASYIYAARGGRGTSSLIEFLGDDRARLNNATYSTCAPDDDSWWVKAETIDMDKIDESGVGRWACLYFKGVPVLPLPYFTFPLGEQRRSGLLTPTLGFSSTKGTDITVPYYFNLAPNYDLTVAPRILSRRGVLLQDEFRYLYPTNNGTLNYDILPNDRTTGTTRDLLRVVDNYSSGGVAGAINYTRVSDDNFFRDFSNSIVGSSQSVLTQDAYVGLYRDDWNTAIRVTKNQTLQDPLNPVVKPYERVPQLTFNAFRYDLQGFETSMGLEATRFEHPTMDSGTRYIANPKIAFPFLAPGWFVIPRAQLSSTYYSMDEATTPVVRESSRTLPIVSLDTGLIFDRDVTWFGRAAQQTLEPRLYYAYIPYRDQSKLPNFDSALPDLNFSQFFTENIYSGSDRIGEANQLTAAISTRVLDSESGLERVRATLGQRYYAGSQRVTLPTDTTTRTSNSSDLLAAVTGTVSRSLLIDTAVQYSAEQNQTQRATIGARWQPAAASVLSAYYRYRVGDISQFDIATQWPITSRWYGVARTNYSTKDRSLIEALAGIEYKADCWVLRVVAQRFVTSTLTYTSNFFIQLELNGLGGVGTSPVEQLQRNIPGYQLVNPLPREPGRFDYYE